MRAFIVVCCLLSATLAAPQGYNYQRSGTDAFNTFNTAQAAPSFLQEALKTTQVTQNVLNTQGSTSSVQSTGAVQQPKTLYGAPPKQIQTQQTITQEQLSQQQLTQEQLRIQQEFFKTFAQSFTSFNPGNVAPPVVTKDIYVYVGADQAEEPVPLPPPPPPRKHYRILFIKAPAPASGALHVKQAPVEEKTIIYVLTKKADTHDLEQALQEAAPKQPSKPEVYFIKYKTQEEAQQAQRNIQSKYDQLGGTSQVSDEGVAPVFSAKDLLNLQSGSSSSITTNTNVQTSGAGLIDQRGLTTSSSSSSTGIQAPSQYLPPITRL